MTLVRFGRLTTDPTTPVNGERYDISAPLSTTYRPKVGGPGGVLKDIDAPTLFQHGQKQNALPLGNAGQYLNGLLALATMDKSAVGLSNVDNTADINKIVSTLQQAALDLKANDNAVVKLTGTQMTIAGDKGFTSPLTIVAPTANLHATTKLYVDTADGLLRTDINNLQSSVANGTQTPIDIDCSTNPNYPASVKGQQYRVLAPGGKIGGPTGPEVNEGDIIACKITSAAGTHAVVGMNFYMYNSNVIQATETNLGLSYIATSTEGLAGSNAIKYMTPLTVEQKMDSAAVRHDKNQGLGAPAQLIARNNIGAIAASQVAANETDPVYTAFKPNIVFGDNARKTTGITSGTISDVNASGFYYAAGAGISDRPGGLDGYVLKMQNFLQDGFAMEIGSPATAANALMFRKKNNGVVGAWRSIVEDTRNIIAGTGITGGGTLAADRTLAFDTTWGDNRYALKSGLEYFADTWT